MIVAGYEEGAEPLVVDGTFNDQQADRNPEEWREESARHDPDARSAYTVCDLR